LYELIYSLARHLQDLGDFRHTDKLVRHARTLFVFLDDRQDTR
jgi:hypothetical protein